MSDVLIAGCYAVDTSQVLLEAGGGQTAYLARDRKVSDGRRIAVLVSRDASPRIRHLNLLDEPIDDLMVPLGHGAAPLGVGKGDGYFVICSPAPGPPVSASLSAWPEKALIDLVLRPIATVLNVLHGRRLTHRGIRPNNVFQAATGQPVTLGAAWGAPAAMLQPAVYETAYSAMCHPLARGEGTIADDVYALGVLLLTLSTGRIPMANMDDAAIIRLKLDMGSFAALTRDIPVAGGLVDLLHAMLAEDPEHRPLPGPLLDLATTRGRRVAARPARRSQNPLMLNDIAISDARSLAYALSMDEKKSIQFLRNGLVTNWLRRGLNDASLATRVEDIMRGRSSDPRSGQRSDPVMVMTVISTLNPYMPLCWRGTAIWPDALPAILAEGIASKPDLLALAEELMISDIAGSWSADQTRQSRPEPPDLMLQRQLLQSGGPGGVLRLFYGLNPLLPCRVPAMAKAWIASMADLMQFFEGIAPAAGTSLIDPHIAAFIAVRSDRKIEARIDGMSRSGKIEAFRLDELTLLQDLQARFHPTPLPALAKWMAARLRPELDRWRNKPKREALLVRLDALAQAGILSKLLELVTDPGARALDVAGALRAKDELAIIDAEVAAIKSEEKLRFADSQRFGQAITGGIGLSALILVLMSVLLR